MAEFPVETTSHGTSDIAPSYRNSKRLAWLILALSVTFLVAMIALESTACGFLIDPSQPAPGFAYGIALVPISALAFSLLGTLVITYRPGNRIGWVMLLFGLGFNALLLLFSYSNCAVRGVLPLPLGAEVFWLSEVLASLIAAFGFVLLFSLFPDGQFLSPRWRRLTWFLAVLMLVFVILRAIVPGPMGQTLGDVAFENPFGQQFLEDFGLDNEVELANLLILPIFSLVGILSLILRWRRSVGETRQQIKWIAYFVATAGVLFVVVEIIGGSIYPPIFDGWFYFFVLTIFWIGLPLVIAIAVLKYRLYDIDIVIRRTLLYGLLTAILITIYFGIVLLVQSAFVTVTGQESPIAIVISTLIIAALFNPLRKRLQAFIDRRFYRRNYDAGLILQQFAQTSRDEVDMEQLKDILLRSVNETMQPQSIGFWLKPGEER